MHNSPIFCKPADYSLDFANAFIWTLIHQIIPLNKSYLLVATKLSIEFDWINNWNKYPVPVSQLKRQLQI